MLSYRISALSYKLSRLSSLSAIKNRMSYYAVKRGKETGVFRSWKECEEQVKGYTGARYKKFASEEEAEAFVSAPHSPGKAPKASVPAKEPPDKKVSGGGHCKENESPHSEHGRVDIAPSKPMAQSWDIPVKLQGTVYANAYSLKCQLNIAKQLTKQLHEMTLKLPLCPDVRELQSQSSLLKDTVQECAAYATALMARIKQEAVIGRLHVADAGDEAGSKGTKRSHEDTGSGKDKGKEPAAKDKEQPEKKQKTAAGKHKVVYTDGCCFFNGKHGATAGIGVYWGRDDPNNVSEKLDGKQTNNKAEITAATRAIEQAKEMGLDSLEIRTDSQFMIDCATKWMPGWKKKDWKKSDGAEVKNKEELQELDTAQQGLDVTWVHVEGHAGHEGNEQADKLAKQGAKKVK